MNSHLLSWWRENRLQRVEGGTEPQRADHFDTFVEDVSLYPANETQADKQKIYSLQGAIEDLQQGQYLYGIFFSWTNLYGLLATL